MHLFCTYLALTEPPQTQHRQKKCNFCHYGFGELGGRDQFGPTAKKAVLEHLWEAHGSHPFFALTSPVILQLFYSHFPLSNQVSSDQAVPGNSAIAGPSPDEKGEGPELLEFLKLVFI